MLTPEEIAYRSDKVGASDASMIMAGKWRALWRRKRGLDIVPKTVDMRIGDVTEILHPEQWAEKGPFTNEGHLLHPGYTRERPSSVHPNHPRIVAKLDFVTMKTESPVESKWHGFYMDDEDMVQKYYWQLQHQLMVTGKPYGFLTILRPGAWSYERVNADPLEQAKLMEALQAFLWILDQDEEPDDAATIVAPDFAKLVVYDMTKSNHFSTAAYDVALTEKQAKQYEAAKEELKYAMPDDAHVAYVRSPGQDVDVIVTRRKDNALIVKVGKVPEKHARKAVVYGTPALAEA